MAFSARQSILVVLGVAMLVFLTGYQVHNRSQNISPKPMLIQGQIMGTTYSIKAVPVEAYRASESLRDLIHPAFAELERLMSTYRDDSEISAINRAPIGECVAISADTHVVLEQALALSQTTQGQFDLSIGPLVELWGFGAKGRIEQPPVPSAIQAAVEQVGYEAISLEVANSKEPCVQKVQARTLDLSAIAKGYAVDQVADFMDSLGFESFLIELGGEIWAQGVKPNGDPWTVAIEVPTKGALGKSPVHVIALEGAAGMATSGDYRNFFEYQGRAFSHTIDAKTGYPVDNQLASVTVLASDVATADGWATALMASPNLEQAQAYAQAHDISVLFIQRIASETETQPSSAFNLIPSKRFCSVYGCEGL